MGQASSNASGETPASSSSIGNPTDSTSSELQSCPVDHQSREAWLQQAAQSGRPSRPDKLPTSVQHKERKPFSFFWSSSNLSQQAQPASPLQPKVSNSRLSTDREISSIPRGLPTSSHTSISASHAAPPTNASTNPSAASPNKQTSHPHTSSSGNWIYPSEEMFFNAMRRKSHNPQAEDMNSVIPIHNAVNEKTWKDILAWEFAIDPKSRVACGGPKLVSFSGDSQKLTPRARWNIFRGYEKPFDRHDWVIDRCGKKVEYVIDFYAGKRKSGDNLGPSFFLDVRPKLNSWEGCKMRVLRALGWSG